jgi:RNA polymerase sigma factor (sigma-70 family)
MKNIKTWQDYKYSRKLNPGYPNLAEDEFLHNQLQTRHRQKALDEIITINMSQVHKICKSYHWCNLDYEDLIQYAIEGIIAAADNYKPESGNKFSTLAYHYILGRVRRAIEQYNHTIKIPAHINLAKLRINHLDLEKEITDEELLPLVTEKYSLYTLRQAIIAKGIKIQEFDPTYDVDVEFVEDQTNEATYAINQVLSTLRPIDKKCIEMYFGLNGQKKLYYKEIDKMLDIDSEGIIKRALVKLSNIKGIDSFLDYIKK